jgi:hypothetical protein
MGILHSMWAVKVTTGSGGELREIVTGLGQRSFMSR